MKALSKLQGRIVVQAAAHDSVVEKFSERARALIAASALAVLAVSSGGAHAQSNEVLKPSTCAMVGATVGAAGGAAAGSQNYARVILGALGGLGGAAVGDWLCSKDEKAKDSSYERAEGYGGTRVDAKDGVGKSTPKVALSISERERLDEMSGGAIDAKAAWKRALWDIQVARNGGNQAALTTAMESESTARHSFETRRAVFATAVAKLHNGSEGMEPRAVGRYLEVSAALLELDTESKVSYATLAAKDDALMNRSAAYNQETQRAARLRNG